MQSMNQMANPMQQPSMQSFQFPFNQEMPMMNSNGGFREKDLGLDFMQFAEPESMGAVHALRQVVDVFSQQGRSYPAAAANCQFVPRNGPIAGAGMTAKRKFKPPSSKRQQLTAEEAAEIYLMRPKVVGKGDRPKRGSMIRCKAIAPKYGVSPKTIRDIWRGRTWIEATRHLWTREEKERRAQGGGDDESDSDGEDRPSTMDEQDSAANGSNMKPGAPSLGGQIDAIQAYLSCIQQQQSMKQQQAPSAWQGHQGTTTSQPTWQGQPQQGPGQPQASWQGQPSSAQQSAWQGHQPAPQPQSAWQGHQNACFMPEVVPASKPQNSHLMGGNPYGSMSHPSQCGMGNADMMMQPSNSCFMSSASQAPAAFPGSARSMPQLNPSSMGRSHHDYDCGIATSYTPAGPPPTQRLQANIPNLDMGAAPQQQRLPPGISNLDMSQSQRLPTNISNLEMALSSAGAARAGAAPPSYQSDHLTGRGTPGAPPMPMAGGSSVGQQSAQPSVQSQQAPPQQGQSQQAAGQSQAGQAGNGSGNVSGLFLNHLIEANAAHMLQANRGSYPQF